MYFISEKRGERRAEEESGTWIGWGEWLEVGSVGVWEV
jgi:hypothetical protein